MLYPILLFIYQLAAGLEHTQIDVEPTFDRFSSAHVAIVLAVLLFVITARKEIAIFIRLASLGTYAIIALVSFIMGYGIYGLSTT